MKKSLLLLFTALICPYVLNSQSTPTHPLDIEVLDASDKAFLEWFPEWEIGTPPGKISAIDDEFYKSRVRPLKRISKEDDTYDANPNAPYERLFCGFFGADDPTATWKALPRYCFEGDTWNVWSYTDMFSNWTAPFFRCSAGLSDAAAKNGTSVGVCWTMPYNAEITWNTENPGNDYAKKFALLFKRDENGKFLYAEKLVRLMKYYGINALGFNSEFRSNTESMTILQDFFAECHEIAKKLDWKFEIHWYAGTTDSGRLLFDTGLTYSKKTFGSGDRIVSDMFFLNYNWTKKQIEGFDKAATDLGRSPYDVFAGFDIQGRSLRRTLTPDYVTKGWQWIKDNKVSIGFWGAHRQNLVHESSNDFGSTDIAIQTAYLTKQELIANGGYHNPAVRPAVDENCGLTIATIENRFHGLADMMTAKSTISNVPFVTRFSLGNGLKYYNRGAVAFDTKWYNLSMQDFLPTWRWWITDRNDNATKATLDKFVKAELTWEDAWIGGSCLKLSGATDFSRIKLFKTLLKATADEELSIVYKPVSSKEPKMKLFVSLKGSVTQYKEIAVPAGNQGEWNTFTAKLSDLGITSGEIALIGIVVENTDSDYQTLIGEIALRDKGTTFAPVKPEIKEVEILRGRYNALDFKMRYAAKEETGEMKTYNDEVDTWYYEIFIQQEGEEPILLTSTTSWAAYVIGAPLKSGKEHRKARFGVRAVSPDGDTYDSSKADEIAWTEEMMEIPYNEMNNEIEIDKKIVKKDEKFSIRFKDDMAPAPQKWVITRSYDEKVVATAENVAEIETSISEPGVYDVCATTDYGEIMIRAGLHVTPLETGTTPEIESLSADKTTAETGEDVKYTYTGNDGKGSVSRGVRVCDPEMLQIPGEIQQGNVYSYALWFKAEKFAHLSNGTNLLCKNTIKDKWAYNNWGDLWVHIRGAGQNVATNKDGEPWEEEKTHGGEISWNVFGYNSSQEPWGEMMSKKHYVSEGVWNHLVITQDAGKNQCMYLNGKLVAKAKADYASRREYAVDQRIDYTATANIHIGGMGPYKAGFNGVIDEVMVWNRAISADEVLEAMKGYKADAIPDGLQGYYTFEDMDENGEFINLGKAGAGKKARIIVLEGAGGEDTSNGKYVKRQADNNVAGNPSIEGTLSTTATQNWHLTDAKVRNREEKTATIVYFTPGVKDVTLTISNPWGSDTYTVENMVEITGEPIDDGVNNTDTGNLEVVYYNGIVNFHFNETGEYNIDIITIDGKTVQQESIVAMANGMATVRLNGVKGIYIIQVKKEGRILKTVKVRS